MNNNIDMYCGLTPNRYFAATKRDSLRERAVAQINRIHGPEMLRWMTAKERDEYISSWIRKRKRSI